MGDVAPAALVLVCGGPGSGKSTLCAPIPRLPVRPPANLASDIDVIFTRGGGVAVLEADAFEAARRRSGGADGGDASSNNHNMECHGDDPDPCDETFEAVAWAAGRRDLLARVESLAEALVTDRGDADIDHCGGDGGGGGDSGDCERDRVRGCGDADGTPRPGSGRPCAVLVIVDTFHLRGMRLPYAKIARRLRLGFAMLLVACPVETAVARNRARRGTTGPVVPESVVRSTHTDAVPRRMGGCAAVFDASGDTIDTISFRQCLDRLAREAVSAPLSDAGGERE
jgi:hypothetical protein